VRTLPMLVLLPRPIICSRLASRNLGVVMGELWTTKSVWFRADRPHLWLRRPPGNGSERAGARV
jgi:hypothetical protein